MNAFAAWGRLVHRRRWLVLAASALLLAASLGVLATGGTLQSYATPKNTESGEADALIRGRLPEGSQASILFVLTNDAWNASSSAADADAFRRATDAALAPLSADARVTNVTTPWNARTPAAGAALVSHDGHHVLAIVTLKDDLETARDEFPELRAKVASDALAIHATDSVAIFSDINRVLDEDLQRSELYSLPLSVILLLVVFGTLVAALLPVGVGALAVVGGIAGVMLASRATDVSVYAVNIVTLIGLGVAIDYSLFVVSRFREELAKGITTERAIERTMKTAGRATFFSGLTVAIGLLGLTFYRGLYFTTMGMAGAIVVTLAVLAALTFLPALLSILGARVNKGRIPLPRRKSDRRLWHDVATAVMKRPLVILLPLLVILIVAGLPFARIQLSGGGVNQLPAGAESRIGFELLKSEFPALGSTTIPVIAQFPPGSDPLSPARIDAIFDATREIAALPGVARIESIVTLDPSITKAQYEQMYAPAQRAQLAPGAAQVLHTTVGADFVVLYVHTPHEATGQPARDLVTAIRAIPGVGPDGRILVTGVPAVDLDTIRLVEEDTPIAIAFIVLTTYALLLLQTGSVLLPLKALAMNLLSISASFGALVWIFQEGHLSGLLHFTPAPLDPSIPVLLFCIVFGLSMDYEVLMLSRMHEEYLRSGDNTHSVAWGLEHTGRLVTSAAAIMVLVFASFATAQVTLIKAIGFGLALAVAIDATLVRALVVPAAMRLMGDWNWWSPRWMRERLTWVRH